MSPSPTAADAELVTLARVREAAARIAGSLVTTPTQHSHTLSQLHGAELWFKFDQQQFTSSFKERGALNKLQQLSESERQRGVIAASAGNHAQAVAHHAHRLGIAATIVMPVSAPFIKVTNTEVLGARVLQFGATVDAANEHARDLAARSGATLVHPFNDVDVICGQGTLALEVLAALPHFDCIVVPVGGGGLISGVACVIKALAPHVRIVGVQSELFSPVVSWFGTQRSTRREATGTAQGVETHPQSDLDPTPGADVRHAGPPSFGPFGADTLADGIAVKAPGVITRVLIERWVDACLTVSESSLEQACNAFLELEKCVVEGAGAAALAAVIEHPEQFAGQRVLCVVSGGNMDPRVLADTVLRGLARTGRLARLRVDVRDLPGSLADITRIVADAGANIVDVRHERVFLATPLLRTRLSLELATRHREHAQEVASALRRAGHHVEILLASPSA